jgi:gluconate 2-dehydrogenase gamma chain
MRRREFLIIPAGAIVSTLLPVLARESVRLEAEGGQARVPLRFFTAAEARVVSAACERIFPGDASGPGATDAGVVIYIDRQLAGPYGRDKYRYVKPPFVTSVPEHGHQGKESPRQIYRAGIRDLGNFADLPVEDRDKKLLEIESTRFFALLRSHTIEGMFCDPMHGGNADLVSWKMIGYPGPRLSYRDDIDKHFGQPWRPMPTSLRQLIGQATPGWEDEKE